MATRPACGASWWRRWGGGGGGYLQAHAGCQAAGLPAALVPACSAAPLRTTIGPPLPPPPLPAVPRRVCRRRRRSRQPDCCGQSRAFLGGRAVGCGGAVCLGHPPVFARRRRRGPGRPDLVRCCGCAPLAAASTRLPLLRGHGCRVQRLPLCGCGCRVQRLPAALPAGGSGQRRRCLLMRAWWPPPSDFVGGGPKAWDAMRGSTQPTR